MARPKKTATTPKAPKQTRKRRDLAERIKTFDTAKIMALKATAEQTIRLIAAEGLRRQSEFATMQDTSVLTETTPTVKVVTEHAVMTTPYAATATPNNGRSSTTSP